MHLKTLTLKGFKSFASSTTLRFEPGITCVVGPNGSGKSNVVDALAWVMGEQGAKSLRGGKMEDVIFAGTTGRAPLGRAEVALTIDNTDGALPIEYTEVTISRTMFRSGGSEYAINGTPARLLDIQELLSDSGIGREMHVIVGQGQLDQVLHATPEDRRGFIEEAAGVLKHRKRKEKALRKLDAMQANLTRVSDLTAEIRRQLGPLGKQAEVARRAVTIQSDVRDARARLLADELVQLTSTLEQEVADETALRSRRAEVEQAIAAGREALGALEREAADAAPRLTEAAQTWYGLSGLRERLRGTGTLAAERMRLLGSQDPVEAADTGRDPDDLRAQAERARVEEQELAAEVEQAREVLEEPGRRARRGRERARRGRAARGRAAARRRRPAGGAGPARRAGRRGSQPGGGRRVRDRAAGALARRGHRAGPARAAGVRRARAAGRRGRGGRGGPGRRARRRRGGRARGHRRGRPAHRGRAHRRPRPRHLERPQGGAGDGPVARRRRRRAAGRRQRAERRPRVGRRAAARRARATRPPSPPRWAVPPTPWPSSRSTPRSTRCAGSRTTTPAAPGLLLGGAPEPARPARPVRAARRDARRAPTWSPPPTRCVRRSTGCWPATSWCRAWARRARSSAPVPTWWR